MYESAYMDSVYSVCISQKAQKNFTRTYFLCADVKKMLSKGKVIPFTENEGLFTICS